MKDVETPDLVRAYLAAREGLLRYFALRLGSQAAAEDLIQDMYVRVATLEVGSIDHPIAYLYRLGTNLMLDRARQRRRAEARDDAWQDSFRITADGEPVADEPAADDAVADRQRLCKLLAALDRLPPQRRMAFRLHKLEGFSHAATAQSMGVSRSAVEKHIIAALRQLTEILAE